ncbi:MAG: hypothetical protein KDC37_06350 [Flavobacteriales bacterium]|nr:hypothetical protein [Flavobacteriales bacterium]
MTDTTQTNTHCCKSHTSRTGNASGGMVYGMGFIGAAIYFISVADGFWAGAVGCLKAVVWPAYLVYYAFEALLS